jgi:hypothetical protein
MRRYAVLTVLVFALLTPPAAAGDGVPPVGANAGPAGVTMPGLAYRWVTVRVRGHTLIAAIERRGGRIDVTRIVRAPLVVPAVAYDMSATGLSADGTTLVLARERRTFPQRRSGFTVLDANTLQPRDTIALRGDFTLDAVSPDGGRLYFIQAKTPVRYAVRAYDVAQQRLLPGAIVDPEEADEPMEGIPLARAMSPDGRVAYTLYERDGSEWFVHALDTELGEARCIDLDRIAPVDDLRAGRDGTLILTAAGAVVRRVDTRPKPVVSTRTSGAAAGPGWAGIVAGAALLTLLGVAAARGSRMR